MEKVRDLNIAGMRKIGIKTVLVDAKGRVCAKFKFADDAAIKRAAAAWDARAYTLDELACLQ